MQPSDQASQPERRADAAFSPDDLVAIARGVVSARLAIRREVSFDLTHAPVLDILLALYLADDRAPIGIRTLAVTAALSLVSLERWLRTLEGEGLVARAEGAAALTDMGRARVDAAMRAVIRSQMNDRD